MDSDGCYLLCGIHRVQGSRFSRPRCLPVTFYHVQLIYHRLVHQRYTPSLWLMLHTASSLAFFSLLRCSEYTSHRRSFEASHTLMVQDILFTPDGLLMKVHIKSSKTDPFREACTIQIAAIHTPCPVALMQEYLHSHPSGAGPLFAWSVGQYLTRDDMVLMLRRCFPGVPNINTHSFRIGGASAAALAGIPDSQIQILGRWSSDAYRMYFHLGDNSVTAMGLALVRGGLNTRVWDSASGGSVPFLHR